MDQHVCLITLVSRVADSGGSGTTGQSGLQRGVTTHREHRRTRLPDRPSHRTPPMRTLETSRSAAPTTNTPGASGSRWRTPRTSGPGQLRAMPHGRGGQRVKESSAPGPTRLSPPGWARKVEGSVAARTTDAIPQRVPLVGGLWVCSGASRARRRCASRGHVNGPTAQRSSRRMSTRGSRLITESVTATLVNPPRSDSARVPR